MAAQIEIYKNVYLIQFEIYKFEYVLLILTPVEICNKYAC